MSHQEETKRNMIAKIDALNVDMEARHGEHIANMVREMAAARASTELLYEKLDKMGVNPFALMFLTGEIGTIVAYIFASYGKTVGISGKEAVKLCNEYQKILDEAETQLAESAPAPAETN